MYAEGLYASAPLRLRQTPPIRTMIQPPEQNKRPELQPCSPSMLPSMRLKR